MAHLRCHLNFYISLIEFAGGKRIAFLGLSFSTVMPLLSCHLTYSKFEQITISVALTVKEKLFPLLESSFSK